MKGPRGGFSNMMLHIRPTHTTRDSYVPEGGGERKGGREGGREQNIGYGSRMGTVLDTGP